MHKKGNMKVLLINGSPRREGNTFIALSEVAKTLNDNGVETEIINIGNKPVRGCIACYKCRENESEGCVFKDELYSKVIESLKTVDGLVIGSPVYFAGANGSLCALLDRVFFSFPELLEFKPAASVAVSRRGGAGSTFDRLNKYFTITNMPVVSSQYWNSVHGAHPGDALHDAEGLQTMRTLGRNMVWMLKNLKEGKYPLPERETVISTNFIR